MFRRSALHHTMGWLHSRPPPPPTATPIEDPFGGFQRVDDWAVPSTTNSNVEDLFLHDLPPSPSLPTDRKEDLRALVTKFVSQLRQYAPRSITGAPFPELTAEVLRHQLGESFCTELHKFLHSRDDTPLEAFSCVASALLACDVWVSMSTCRLAQLSIREGAFVLTVDGGAQTRWGLNFDIDIQPLVGGHTTQGGTSSCGILGCKFVNALQTGDPASVADPNFIHSFHIPIDVVNGHTPIPLAEATALRGEMRRRLRRSTSLQKSVICDSQKPHEIASVSSPLYVPCKAVVKQRSKGLRVRRLLGESPSPLDANGVLTTNLLNTDAGATAALRLSDGAVAAALPPGPMPSTSPATNTVLVEAWVTDAGSVSHCPFHVHSKPGVHPSTQPFEPWRLRVSGSTVRAEGRRATGGGYFHVSQLSAPGSVTPASQYVPHNIDGSSFPSSTQRLMGLRHRLHGYTSALWLTESEGAAVLGSPLRPHQQPVFVPSRLPSATTTHPSASLTAFFNASQFELSSTRKLNVRLPTSTALSGIPLVRDLIEVGNVLAARDAVHETRDVAAEPTLNGDAVNSNVGVLLGGVCRRKQFASPSFFTTSFIGSLGLPLKHGERSIQVVDDTSSTGSLRSHTAVWPQGYAPDWVSKVEQTAAEYDMLADPKVPPSARGWAATTLLLQSRVRTLGGLEDELIRRLGEDCFRWPHFHHGQVPVPPIALSRSQYLQRPRTPTSTLSVVNVDQIDIPISSGRFRQVLQVGVDFVWPSRYIRRFSLLRKLADSEIISRSQGDPRDAVLCPADLLAVAGIDVLPNASPVMLSHEDFFAWFTDSDNANPFVAASQTSAPDQVLAMNNAHHVMSSGTPIHTNHARAVLSAICCKRGFLSSSKPLPQVWFSLSHLLKSNIRLRPCPACIPGVGDVPLEIVGNALPSPADPRCVDLEAHYPQYNLGTSMGGRVMHQRSQSARCLVHLRDLAL